ncbi:phosphotransferase [Vagococcus carniphilus]|uniref:phosphotransferase n=1 Tax=Vagococcus carniphilus TaxID=218144 RepID=UPI003BA86133
MTHQHILKAFNFETHDTLHSIYPYSPVYKIKKESQSYVIKQTRSSIEESNHVALFLERLNQLGIQIVTPVKLDVNNPLEIDEEVWTVYPFINGQKYTGTDQQIVEAGKLLGSIHALSSNNNKETLAVYEEYEFEEKDIQDDFSIIETHLKSEEKKQINSIKNSIPRLIKQQEILKTLNLPKVATPYDFKADNLIYQTDNTPYLIDPDNAIFIPRIFDLALTLLLFHNVLESAPKTTWTPDKWELFLKGYKQYVTLTKEEINYFPIAVEHLFIDEVVWLMADFEEGWRNNRQRNFFLSIFTLLEHLNNYSL